MPLRSVQRQVIIRSTSGQPQVNIRRTSGQYQESIRSISGNSQGKIREKSGEIQNLLNHAILSPADNCKSNTKGFATDCSQNSGLFG
jgi:hypothetical protein